MILNGFFTSFWSDMPEIVTDATLNTETGEVTAESVDVGKEYDNLDSEIFTDDNGNDYDVCPECHEYILVTSMEDGIGHNLNEVRRCKNPDCDYVWMK